MTVAKHVYVQQQGHPPRRVDLPTRFGEGDRTYELKNFIGGGGNSAVFGIDIYEAGKFAGRRALKVLKQLDPTRIDRFQNEIRILKGIEHPQISRFYASGEVRVTPSHEEEGDRLEPEGSVPLDLPFVIIDAGGSNLRRRVEEQSRFTGNDFKVAANDMVEAVLHIHSKGVIHRDVKPENFVVSQQHAGRVFMIDFGIAKYIGEDVAQRPLDNLTKQKEFVGPQAFCSPELLRYARDKAVLVDARSDLFQLGKVLWFMATGMVSAGIPSKRLDPFKGSLHALVSALLSDDPDDRVVGDLKVAVANL